MSGRHAGTTRRAPASSAWCWWRGRGSRRWWATGYRAPFVFPSLPPPLAPPTPFPRGSSTPPPPSRTAAPPASAPAAPASASSPRTRGAAPPGSRPADSPSPPATRESGILHAQDIHARELQALGRMQREEVDAIGRDLDALRRGERHAVEQAVDALLESSCG